MSKTSNQFSIFKKKLLKHCLLTELWCKVEWGGWEGRTNKDSVCPHFSSFLILISYLSLGINMHKMSCDLYFSLQNIDWNCLHSRFLSDTTSKCLARCDRSPNITWDCGSKKRNVFASITKGSLANFSNTILGAVGELETLKNHLNQGGLVGGGSNSCRKLFQYLSKVWKW